MKPIDATNITHLLIKRGAIMHSVCAIVHTSLLATLVLSVCLIERYISGILFVYLLMYETNIIVSIFFVAVHYTTCTGSVIAYIG